MRIEAKRISLLELETPLLVVNLFEKLKKPSGATEVVDKALNGLISSLIKDGEIKGKLGEATVIHTQNKIKPKRVLVVGLGTKDEFNEDVIRKASAEAVKRAKSIGVAKLATIVHGAGQKKIPLQGAAKALVEGALLRNYNVKDYKSKKEDEDKNEIEEILIVDIDKQKIEQYKKGILLGESISNAMNNVKDLVNMPSNILTPEKFVDIAKKLAKDKGLKIEIFNANQLKALGAGAFMGVSQGAKNPAYMIKLSYKSTKNKKTLGLVGKGITFDSGGISIKPSKGMWEMKGDMAGAATVLCLMELLDVIKPNMNVTAVLPLTENMPDGGAYKPGDVLKTVSGKSIEIMNTDAEGRLILSDALGLIQKEKKDYLIDIATLTGAARIALGSKISAVMGNDKELVKKIVSCGKKAGENIWEMPLLKEYRDLLKSKIADIKNCQDSGGEAGTIIGGIFLKEFVNDDVKWAHLDIAATAGFAKDKHYQAGGATAMGLRTLVELLGILN